MLPIASGAVCSLAADSSRQTALTRATIGWSGAILCFLAGVRRGLSFRQPGGPTMRQKGEMLLVFNLGSAALLSRSPGPALVSLATGYAASGLLDPIAAAEGEAPRYFARLRPWQMAIPVASLLALLAGEIRRSR